MGCAPDVHLCVPIEPGPCRSVPATHDHSHNFRRDDLPIIRVHYNAGDGGEAAVGCRHALSTAGAPSLFLPTGSDLPAHKRFLDLLLTVITLVLQHLCCTTPSCESGNAGHDTDLRNESDGHDEQRKRGRIEEGDFRQEWELMLPRSVWGLVSLLILQQDSILRDDSAQLWFGCNIEGHDPELPMKAFQVLFLSTRRACFAFCDTLHTNLCAM